MGRGGGPPITLDDSVHVYRLRVMARAHALGNVTRACEEAGVSRTLFYRWRRRSAAYGAPGLHPLRHGPQRGRPSILSVQAERAILALALAWPTWGPTRLAVQVARPEAGGSRVAPVQGALDRGLGFYNHQRPHPGYRTGGRRLAEIFWTSSWADHHEPVKSA